MSTLAAFVLGILVGVTIYWFIYRFYWQRWRSYLQRDALYLQEKVKSVEYTNAGLERQLSDQKANLARLSVRITDLERDKRKAEARLDENNADRQAITVHLETLRAELATYKTIVAEPVLRVFPIAQPQNGNGKAHRPEVALRDRKSETATAPVNGSGRNQEALEPPNWNRFQYPPAEPCLDPMVIIERPRMDCDRLEILPGIGQATAKKLRLAGIDTFAAVGALSVERLKKLVGPGTASRLDAERVIRQAKDLAGYRAL
jgi:predicted flap endonuclease-1-like 5' DNA nuclease